ncbi:inner membrane protein [compost metagenome]
MTGKGHLWFGVNTGIATAVITKIPLTPITIGAGLALVVVSSLAADLDEPSSKLGRTIIKPGLVKIVLILITISILFLFGKSLSTSIVIICGVLLFSYSLKDNPIRNVGLTIVGTIAVLFGIWDALVWLMGIGSFLMIAPWTKHRTVTHTIWAVVFWYVICLDIQNRYMLPCFSWLGTITYASHLVGDSLTKAKVKWLWPILNIPIGISLIRVGSNKGDIIEHVINCTFTIVLGIIIFK